MDKSPNDAPDAGQEPGSNPYAYYYRVAGTVSAAGIFIALATLGGRWLDGQLWPGHYWAAAVTALASCVMAIVYLVYRLR